MKYNPIGYIIHVFDKMTQKKIISIKEIYFTNKRNRSFRINILEGTSLPNPPKAVKQNKLKIKNYLQELATIEALQIEEAFHPKDFYSKMAEIEFINANKSKWSLSLYSQYKENKGYYLLYDEKLYKINKKQLHLFMANAQDFWIKKLLLPKVAKGNIKFPGREPVYLKVQDHQQFKVDIIKTNRKSSKRISHKEFQRIYNFLKKEADFISLFDISNQKSQGVTESLFYLKLDNLVLNIKRTKAEVIVHDQTSNLEYHYITGGRLPFTYNPNEVLIK